MVAPAWANPLRTIFAAVFRSSQTVVVMGVSSDAEMIRLDSRLSTLDILYVNAQHPIMHADPEDDSEERETSGFEDEGVDSDDEDAPPIYYEDE
jgi:hypothetical protein